ncbi:mitochondria fission 1-like protein [Kickxella alabastrina]|uniref:mitochondria fission 1-like protein n=1 Tax=Kickxella alabastrina TaxID=61397 RepID=UPI00221E5739|nr:mitochondria fission 1-like protein [Kickxella alabastrina]KAI7834145.1 mitochondria fission 1-like protein [Kickxella alabastrina]
MSDGYLPYAAEAEQSLSPSELQVLQRQFEREGTQVRIQTKFNYAWGLIKSAQKHDQTRGVALMHNIYEENEERKRECLYYLGIGYYKMGEYANARVYTERLLALEPGNKQAESLRQLVDEKVARDGLIGLAMSGGAVALLGIAAAFMFKKSK